MIGLNSEIRRKGKAFLVQTQDRGQTVRCVESFVYHAGRLVFSRKTDYAGLLGKPGLEAEVKRLLEQSHRAVLDDIAAGRIDHLLLRNEP